MAKIRKVSAIISGCKSCLNIHRVFVLFSPVLSHKFTFLDPTMAPKRRASRRKAAAPKRKSKGKKGAKKSARRSKKAAPKRRKSRRKSKKA